MSAFFLRQHIEGCREAARSNEQQVKRIRSRVFFNGRQLLSKADDFIMPYTVMQQIREEAARRRELRLAKQKLKEAIDIAVRHRSAEEIQNDVIRSVARIAEEEAAARGKIKEAESAARSARKLALNNAWMKEASSPTCES